MRTRLCLVHDLPDGKEPAYVGTLSTVVSVVPVPFRETDILHDLVDLPWLVDLSFIDAARALRLRRFFRDGDGPVRLLAATASDRAGAVRANALGATAVVLRPVEAGAVLDRLRDTAHPPHRSRPAATLERRRPAGVARLRRTRPTAASAAPPASDAGDPPALLGTVSLAAEALDGVFHACLSGSVYAGTALDGLAARISPALREYGLETWLDLVQRHHSGTYQHSLLVMGIAVGFGHTLGLAEEEVCDLALSGLLHDVGKCWVPEPILAKPGPLTEEEFAVVRRHGHDGWAALTAAGLGLSETVLDAVLHHHEYLDGSGYPDGLAGTAIRRTTRILTVCDIFGALAEHRSYRPAFRPEEILPILQTHARIGHVERDLVAVVAAMLRTAPA